MPKQASKIVASDSAMNEHEILTSVNKYKECIIPREILVWSWFKRYYIENEVSKKGLVQASSKDMEKKDFFKIIKTKIA